VGPFVTAPTRLPEGSRVVLVTDTSGKVLYYKRAQQPPPEIAGLRADLDKVRTDVADVAAARPEIGELKTQIEAQTVVLTTTQASVNEALQLREEVKVLRAELALAQKATEDVNTLRSELTDVQKANTELAQIQKTNQEALVAADREIATLKTSSKEFTTRIGEMQKRLDTLGGQRTAAEARTRKKKQPPTEE
jgi:chromosome segregation ATPase